MAITNHERVGKALETLNKGLLPFVEREMKAAFKSKWLDAARDSIRADHVAAGKTMTVKWDTQSILAVMWNHWNDVFKKTLGHAERSIVSELRDIRNRWAHQNGFSTDDAYRALDSIHRLLTSVAALEAQEIDEQKQQLLRVRFDEQARSQTRRAAAVAIEGTSPAGLKPWREIATPHKDVANGTYQQAEFAADLAQVHRGEGVVEYSDPEEFFRRTFPTTGLQDLWADSLLRLSGKGGNPVIKLQTNFGGGKTHSMIALYHLFSGTPATKLVGVEQILQRINIESIPTAKRVVLVGTAKGVTARTAPDGTKLCTLWGEMAWQLLGKKGYKIVADADQHGVSPGSDALRELFLEAGPCLIMIDEWIAYVRMLYGKNDLPAGTFDANLTFAQSLTEAIKAVPKAQLVASIPSSEIEVGGDAGQEALARLEGTFARMETPWRPASAEESFEIVRRRLFEPITDVVGQDAVVRKFSELYRNQSQEFPSECHEAAYKRRMESAYPIHPELFDRLYKDWSSLERFQRTRGILRLMAAVIHTLWERNDNSLMILPSMVVLEDIDVRKELLRYLDDPWDPVIETDIDGPNSLPHKLDGKNPNLGRYSACRRVTRTLFIGSAPTLNVANRGIEDRRIKLGCALPGESPAIYGDALRRLTDQSTHLYVDKGRYWYAPQANVTRTAQDRAQQIPADDVNEEIAKRLRLQQDRRGGFVKVHACPDSSSDIPDDLGAALIILGPQYSHIAKSDQSSAIQFAQDILENRGTIPRNNKNTLIFLAADKKRLQDLESAVRKYLAWKSVVAEIEELNLDAFSQSLAKTKTSESNDIIDQQIPEAYQWAIFPYQPDQNTPLEWQAVRVKGQGPLAAKVADKLANEGQLNSVFAGILLRMELDKIPLWRGDHVEVKQLTSDFAKYTYLPRLVSTETLLQSIQDGLGKISWSTETYAFANGFDAENNRYLGLTGGRASLVSATGSDLLVKPDIAMAQFKREEIPAESGERPSAGTTGTAGVTSDAGTAAVGGESRPEESEKIPRRFYGTVALDSSRVGRDAGKIAEEIIQHIQLLKKSKIRVTLEIQAEIPDGVPDHIIRTVTENCRTLKFEDHGFEEA